MSTSERVDKFLSDSLQCRTPAQLQKEAERLSVWLQKHQAEIVPPGQQAKLIQVLDVHTKSGRLGYADALLNLVETFLALPEGKLVSAKSKQKCLKLLDSLSEGGGPKPSASPVAKLFTLLDIDRDSSKVTVQNDDTEEILEEVECDVGLLQRISSLFEEDVTIHCLLSPTQPFVVESAVISNDKQAV
jgi:hypothetical protein